jgi:hypothetical protein
MFAADTDALMKVLMRSLIPSSVVDCAVRVSKVVIAGPVPTVFVTALPK